jgi:hypothetical protein
MYLQYLDVDFSETEMWGIVDDLSELKNKLWF